MIKRLIIVNRGEIAVRIIRTCRDLGITSIAVYDESDVGSLHVLLADESVKLDSPKAFTDPGQLLELARLRKADAIHPGYSFLSESAEFARDCNAAGILFIGPSAEALSICASRIDILNKAQEANLMVPEHTVSPLDPSDTDRICKEAEKLGYPVAVKPFRASSGKASPVAYDGDELRRAILTVAREAEVTLQDQRVFLEKAVQPGRRIQVPFLADNFGNVLPLGLIDVSISRHFNRIMSETPPPGISPEQERKITDAAVNFVRKARLNNLGTIEFWLDQTGQFYLTKLLPSIQIEHSATELVMDLDVVAEQIKLACGEKLGEPLPQHRGVAIQMRVYAEDLLRQSLPSPGTLRRFRLPGGPNVRVDAYAYGGCRIPIHFDPLLAAISVWAPDRKTGLNRLSRALRDAAITGVETNLGNLQAVVCSQEVVSGEYNSDTGKRLAQAISVSTAASDDLAALVGAAFYMRRRSHAVAKPARLSGGWYEASRAID